jgi:hypothetical protein
MNCNVHTGIIVVINAQESKLILEFMENAENKNLSFGQRNWLLLCVIVAILSPFLVHVLRVVAHKKLYKQATTIRTSDSSKAKDTSYNVASPPQNQKTDSVAH